MIVDEAARRVILTPPHTASRHLHKALCALPNVYWLISPGIECETWDHHGTKVDAEHRGYRVFVVVRHPFDRLVGCYRHFNWSAERARQKTVTFDRFVEFVERDRPTLYWIHRYTISRWLGDTHYDEVLRFETELWPWVASHYPHASVLPKYGDREPVECSQETYDFLQCWFREDLERWYQCGTSRIAV